MKVEELFNGKFEEKLEDVIRKCAEKEPFDVEITEKDGKIQDVSIKYYFDSDEKESWDEDLKEKVKKNIYKLYTPEKVEKFGEDYLFEEFEKFLWDNNFFDNEAKLRYDILNKMEKEIVKSFDRNITYKEVDELIGEIEGYLDQDRYSVNLDYDYNPIENLQEVVDEVRAELEQEGDCR